MLKAVAIDSAFSPAKVSEIVVFQYTLAPHYLDFEVSPLGGTVPLVITKSGSAAQTEGYSNGVKILATVTGNSRSMVFPGATENFIRIILPDNDPQNVTKIVFGTAPESVDVSPVTGRVMAGRVAQLGITSLSGYMAHCNKARYPMPLPIRADCSCNQAWRDCLLMDSVVPGADFSQASSFVQAWKGTAFVAFPSLDLRAAINFSGAWSAMPELITFNDQNFAAGEDFSLAWKDCTDLVTFRATGFPSATTFQSAWEGCSSLSDFPAKAFDDCPADDFYRAFYGCALTNGSIRNILESLIVAGVEDGELWLSGGTNAVPAADSLALIATLASRGWTIYTN